MDAYLIGQLITCGLIVVGFFVNRYLVDKSAEKVAALVVTEKTNLALKVAHEKELVEKKISNLELRVKTVENASK